MTSLKRVLRPKIQVNGKDMNDVYGTGDNSKICHELFYILDVFTTNISDSVKFSFTVIFRPGQSTLMILLLIVNVHRYVDNDDAKNDYTLITITMV